MIIEVWSGGQNGVDLAGISAAKAIGFPTNGWMPKGFRTLDGPKPEYVQLYNLRENITPDYRDRTWKNVCETDATIRIANDFRSEGEICTINAIINFHKPYLDIKVDCSLFGPSFKKTHEHVAEWIINNKVGKLNIAGNSERSWKGIGKSAYEYLYKVFTLIKGF